MPPFFVGGERRHAGDRRVFSRRWRLCPYGSAKAAAIAHYTQSLAQDLGQSGIISNCIAPGVIATGRIMQTVIPGSSQNNRSGPMSSRPRPSRPGGPTQGFASVMASPSPAAACPRPIAWGSGVID
jgi:NAD(P)-dependent dehydrogenase (short-subunit alcohol dehydrogenase family)